MQNAILEYSQLSEEARKAAASVYQLKLAQYSDNIQERDKIIASMNQTITLPGFSGGGGSSGGGGGGGGSSEEEEDVLEAYKRDQDILEHRIEMSEAAQNLTEEDTEAWKRSNKTSSTSTLNTPTVLRTRWRGCASLGMMTIPRK